MLLAYLRHTSASLVIQENADPDVQTDLVTALDRLAPANAGWVHDTEGPDDMPAHVKAMLNGISLHVPVIGGKLALGTWQGIYLAEHRARPHRREVLLQFIGSIGGQHARSCSKYRMQDARKCAAADLCVQDLIQQQAAGNQRPAGAGRS